MKSFRTPRRFFRRPTMAAMLTAALATGLVGGLVGGLGGCTATSVVVGAGATVGVAAYQERGIEGAAKDLKVAAGVIEEWLKFNHEFNIKLGVEVYEGRAMLTGVADNDQMRADAVRLAWSVSGIRDVINEIQVNVSNDVIDLARDTWITTQLQSTITFDKEVLAINYVIETVNGVVYLIGIAQNQTELDRVINHARNISYVRDIISHVRVKGAA